MIVALLVGRDGRRLLPAGRVKATDDARRLVSCCARRSRRVSRALSHSVARHRRLAPSRFLFDITSSAILYVRTSVGACASVRGHSARADPYVNSHWLHTAVTANLSAAATVSPHVEQLLPECDVPRRFSAGITAATAATRLTAGAHCTGAGAE